MKNVKREQQESGNIEGLIMTKGMIYKKKKKKININNWNNLVGFRCRIPVFANGDSQKVWNSLHAVSTPTPVSSNGPICFSWMAVFCPHGRRAKADQRKIGFCGTVCVTQTQSQLRMASSMVTNLIPSDSFHIIFTSSQTGKIGAVNVKAICWYCKINLLIWTYFYCC